MSNETQNQVNLIDVIHILFDGLQEIIGQRGLQAILNMTALPIEIHDDNEMTIDSLSVDQWVNLTQTLEALYGVRGAQGIAVRTGQVFFRDFFRSFGMSTGMMSRSFRMLPKPKRIQRGIETIAQTLCSYIPDIHADVIQDSENWFLRFSKLDFLSDAPGTASIMLKFIVGILQEFLSWTSGGKFYPVSEMNLSAEVKSGPIIVIQKHYID
jgi:hypothetical protein